MNRTQLAAHIAVLKEWNTPGAAGRARLMFEENMKQHRDPMPIITVPFGTHNGIVAGDGTVYDEDNIPRVPKQLRDESDDAYAKRTAAAVMLADSVKEAKDRMGWLRNVAAGIPEGCVPTVKTIDGIGVIGAGLWLIIAGGGAGKSPLAHALAGHGDTEYGIVRFGEPLAGYTGDPKVAAGQLANAMIEYPEVVLDSVKDVMSLAPGGAMQSGISRSVLPLFTRWAIIAANAGVALYVPVNPSSASKEVVDLLIEAAKSNSTTTVFAEGDNTWRYQARNGEGLIRTEGTFHTDFDSQGLMRIRTRKNGGTDHGEDSPSQATFEVRDDDFAAALRRSIRSQQNTN